MKRMFSSIGILALVALAFQWGCVNVRTPDVRVNTGPPPENINSSQTPPTSSHEEARAELEKAYRHIRYLEDENRRLQKKVEKEKERGDDYKSKYERLKDEYED